MIKENEIIKLRNDIAECINEGVSNIKRELATKYKDKFVKMLQDSYNGKYSEPINNVSSTDFNTESDTATKVLENLFYSILNEETSDFINTKFEKIMIENLTMDEFGSYVFIKANE